MINALDKVLVSVAPPTSQGVLWLNPAEKKLYAPINGVWTEMSGGLETGDSAKMAAINAKEGMFFSVVENGVFQGLYVYREGEWQEFSGGGATLVIGSEAERLTYEDPVEGMEFHQVDYDETEDKYTVRRFVYENRQWVELESPQTETVETVTLHVSTYDGVGVVEGLTVGITDNNTTEVLHRVLDENGECVFEIPKGHSYTVSVESLSGYRDIPDQTYTAAADEKTITLTFLAESSEMETIVVHVTVYNNSLQDITSQDTDLIGLTVSCQIQDGETLTATVGSDHTATFQVPYGSTYTIVEPNVPGYMKRYATSWTHTASIPQRTIPMHYVVWVNVGIYGMTEAGAMYTYEEMAAMTAEQLADIVYIGLNTSRLSNAGSSFFYKVPRVTTSVRWADANVEFDQTLLPFKQNHAAAVLDMDGETNTENIISIGDTLGVGTPAADYCRAQTAVVGNVTKTGFLGSFGQMYALSENITELIAIHALLGVSAPGFTSGYWWTSTQYNATSAVYLNNGGFNYGSKNGNYTTIALFAL